MDTMDDLTGLTHATYSGGRKVKPFQGKQAPPFQKKGAAAKPAKKGIGAAIIGKKKPMIGGKC